MTTSLSVSPGTWLTQEHTPILNPTLGVNPLPITSNMVLFPAKTPLVHPRSPLANDAICSTTCPAN